MTASRAVHDFGAMLNGDLNTSLTIDNIRQSEVGKALEALRDAGFLVEINVSYRPGADQR